MIGNVIPMPWITIGTSGSNPPPYSNEYCFNFLNNSDQGFSVPIAGSYFSKTSAFSISLWTRITTANWEYGIIGNSDSYDGITMASYADGSDIGFFFQMQGPLPSTPRGQILAYSNKITRVASDWYHLVVTYDGSENGSGMKIYLNNGSPETSTSGAWTSSDDSISTYPVALGAYRIDPHNNGLTGDLDEVSFYNYVLTSSNVSAIWNSGVPNDISSLNPQHWYRMGEEATWNGSIWTMPDMGSGSITATGVNMLENDRIIRPT